jgi:hypothetical protein
VGGGEYYFKLYTSVCTKYRDYFYIVISVSDYVVAFGKHKSLPVRWYT